MAKYYQDFIGLNTFIYEPGGYYVIEQADGESSTVGGTFYLEQNVIGSRLTGLGSPTPFQLQYTKNYLFPYNLPTTASFFNALMARRNGAYGYPIWKQTRASHNHLSRKQRSECVFTFVPEPGIPFQTQINGNFENRLNKYGTIQAFIEPNIQDNEKPLRLYAGVQTYDQKLNKAVNRKVLLKASFGNEIVFFANDEINRNYGLILETDENYEQLKGLYLNGALDDDGSPLQSFKLLEYGQSIYPKPIHAYLEKTRARTFFVNDFWRDNRTNRLENNVSNSFGTVVPRQSMWPLDVAEDWGTRAAPLSVGSVSPEPDAYLYYIGGVSGTVGSARLLGYNTGDDTETVPGVSNASSLGGAGVLMNSYSHLARGYFHNSTQVPTFAVSSVDGFQPQLSLTASAYYSKRHTLNSIQSVVSPAGMDIEEAALLTMIATSSLYEGLAAWDAPRKLGKILSMIHTMTLQNTQESRVKGIQLYQSSELALTLRLIIQGCY